MGGTPIIKSNKLTHRRRTVLERQEVAPRVEHVRWKADLSGAAAVAAVLAVGASAHATPGDPGPARYDAVPAAEVAIAPAPEWSEPAMPRVAQPAPAATPTSIAAYAERVPELKENPYTPKREVKHRLVKKPRVTEAAFPRVSDMKANPYD